MVDATIALNDDMYEGDDEHYFRCGKELSDAVEHSIRYLSEPPQSILELPSGHGRVTRYLVDRFGSEKIFIVDIIKDSVDFCMNQFGVCGTYALEPAFEYANIPNRSFDVAVMGSLITHFTEDLSLKILKKFLKKCRKNGIAVVTTLGDTAYQRSLANVWFKVDESEKDAFHSAYATGRYSYIHYAVDPGRDKNALDTVGTDVYGFSLIPRGWMESTVACLGCKIVEFTPAGWDNHNDIYYIAT